jgi:hypothetical protein
MQIVKHCDSHNKGYLAYEVFLRKVSSLAMESRTDAIMRRLGTQMRHKSSTLKKHLQEYDKSRVGKLDVG